ncbi:response regulator [Nitrosopumilus sp. K4]|uniref:response regulator n=1 Tax=Nitrosopumilus sp. K4 TaxID=2795383 RepID=UPI001BA5DA18|nr:response regulator [Nitrosopumilus sp. K4]QUC65515.1 response regulator [Nitrosopumilus sp. K4]
MTIRAIVVDDNNGIRNTFSDLLKMHKINVVGSGNNGLEAVKKFQELKPDVIFLDIMMPKYDGIYAMQEIRKIDPNANIVIISGAGPNEMEVIKKMKPSAIIHKPFDINSILHVLKEELCLETE